MSLNFADTFTMAGLSGTLPFVNKPQKPDSDIEVHFMRALDVALADKGLNKTRAEQIAGIPKGTLSLWMGGKRTPSALRFAEVVEKLGIDPGAIMNDGLRRAHEAGLLGGVEVLPEFGEDS